MVPRRITKDHVATGVSLGRETMDRVREYHSRIENFFWKTEGRRHSFSDTFELLVKAGLEVLGAEDFDEVIDAARKREIPEQVRERARIRRAGVLGGLSDEEVEALLKKARRMR